ncbi:STAS domain-containing protein [Stutzerimonas azotifigens]|uniref:STAS domain-containing protein n=1 Tax=Stutzerimonas azotifigens TaxID=291995 RepID=A0ABR5YVJ4_9GAMM|nr:STAS domain-containing protein [Stutzerimonas azotifigens]MBA1271941.1 STAS domain-containing protein [Stutzerimonas azotifigens]
MSDARITEITPGELRLDGVLDYRSGAALRQAGQALIRKATTPAITIDCSGVQQSSSVGLSLLLAYQRDAMAVGRQLRIVALPDDMREMAGVYGLREVLVFEEVVAEPASV